MEDLRNWWRGSKAELADIEDGKSDTVVVDDDRGSFTFELATTNRTTVLPPEGP